MIRLGLIGCGKWGWRYIGAAHDAGNCQVVAVSRVASAPEEARSAIVPLPVRSSWREMLDIDKVDAFVVAAPPDVHAEICVPILERGIPVMVEKPIALDLGSATQIADAAKATGAPLLVNHQHLFAPAYEELRARVAGWSGFWTTSSGGGPGPFRSYSALWDYGPHDVAMVLGLAHDRSAKLLGAAYDGGQFRLAVRAGNTNSLVRVWNDGEKCRVFSVMSSDCLITYDDLDVGARLRVDDRAAATSTERPLTRAVRAFADAARSRETDWRFDPMFGVEVTRILSDADSMLEKQHGDN